MISGVTSMELRQIPDERGAVLHMLRCDAPEFTHFGECYFSEIVPGAVKAWKRHRAQTQTLAVPVGRIRMVLYDDRQGSTTKDRIQVLELGRPDSYRRLRIPPGLWYGFSCISAMPALIVNCTDTPHDPKESELKPLDYPNIPYHWTTNK
ncbi:MAG: dTDP-4-dehydrorhamnose 3,5-epimerase family protein [Candidatus Vogelbacteria bacterium]|nr:dTDP-4-dehydrorhamnose 3,5-epimerase family protein [Candidatus Vogelbacteria bacterium]